MANYQVKQIIVQAFVSICLIAHIRSLKDMLPFMLGITVVEIMIMYLYVNWIFCQKRNKCNENVWWKKFCDQKISNEKILLKMWQLLLLKKNFQKNCEDEKNVMKK